MSEPPRRHRIGLPHNPGLRDLVEGKRRGSSPPNRQQAKLGFKGWHERGYLPHRDEPGLTQFITFRLLDSYPAALRSEWAALFEIEENRERRKQLENYLDRGRGDCHLCRPEIGNLVEGALRFYHGKLYELCAWVVMPNHVHTLIKVGNTPMSVFVAELKAYTAREANKVLKRNGPFWAEDYWDTYLRGAEHEVKSRRYIENNPTKALLVRDPIEWLWTSARYRNEYGELRL